MTEVFFFGELVFFLYRKCTIGKKYIKQIYGNTLFYSVKCNVTLL